MYGHMLILMCVYMCVCVLALNAVGSLNVIMKTTNLVAFTWSLPAGHFEGFQVYGNTSSAAAANCTGIVYGKNCVYPQPVVVQ